MNHADDIARGEFLMITSEEYNAGRAEAYQLLLTLIETHENYARQRIQSIKEETEDMNEENAVNFANLLADKDLYEGMLEAYGQIRIDISELLKT